MAAVTAQSDLQVRARKQLAVSLGSAYLLLSLVVLVLLFNYRPNEKDMKCFGSAFIWWLSGIWVAAVVISGFTGCILAASTEKGQTLTAEKLETIGGLQVLLFVIRIMYCVTQQTNTSHDGQIRYWIAVADILFSVFLIMVFAVLISKVKEENENQAAAEPRNQLNTEP